MGQDGKLINENELTYVCKFHVAQHNVDRRKFGIRLDGQYNCFACGVSGKSFKTLFKKLKANSSQYKELYSIIGYKFKPDFAQQKQKNVELKLPEEFIPIANPNKSIEYKHAFNYLKKREITRDDILRYNIGYCESGMYKNRIIIPSYDKDANLNFFTARDFLCYSKLKYLLPPWSKNIIGFELFINWDYDGGVTLVESAFNAITIRKNCIPLFGKIISNALKGALIENGVNRINVCLDNDADKNTIKMVDDIKKFTNEEDIDIRVVELTLKDPNEIGFNKMNELIYSAPEADFSYLFKKRLNV